MKIKEITWIEGRFNFHYGRIGRLRVATVEYTFALENKDKPWKLTVEGFGVTSTSRHEHLYQAKASATAGLLRLIGMVTE